MQHNSPMGSRRREVPAHHCLGRRQIEPHCKRPEPPRDYALGRRCAASLVGVKDIDPERWIGRTITHAAELAIIRLSAIIENVFVIRATARRPSTKSRVIELRQSANVGHADAGMIDPFVVHI